MSFENCPHLRSTTPSASPGPQLSLGLLLPEETASGMRKRCCLGDVFHKDSKTRAFMSLLVKSRDKTLLAKVRIVKAMVFPVVMYGCESWTVKKAKCKKTDAFKPRCWRRFLRVLWTAKRSNQSILREINPEYSLGGLMLKLKLQYFGHLMQTANSLENSLRLGKEGEEGIRG